MDKLIVAEEKHNESTLAYQCMHEMTARVFFRRKAVEGGHTIHMGEGEVPPLPLKLIAWLTILAPN